ncbi:MAG TPA: ABC transporter ATP-binding protein [Vicinamibacterales bacterium]|nr:ABC transporter ATP-binding protein [Vicinamibacterales bacterium]
MGNDQVPARRLQFAGPSGAGHRRTGAIALRGAGRTGPRIGHLLGCLDRPTSGQYLFNGRDVAHLASRQLARVRNQEIGFVFQGFNLLPRTSALENVELPLLYAGGVSARERLARATAALEAVGLSRLLRHHPNQMSGGQQQRVAIARALVNNPPLLLADEPTGNLDTRTSVEVMEIFQRLNTGHGLTILLVTHEHDIAEYATRLVAFRDGRIRVDRPVSARRTASADLAAMAAEAQSEPATA